MEEDQVSAEMVEAACEFVKMNVASSLQALSRYEGLYVEVSSDY